MIIALFWIGRALDGVESYEDLGTSQDTIDYFEQLAADAPRGVDIDIAEVGVQTAEDGSEVPLMATEITFACEGRAMYLKSAHVDALLHRPVAREVGRIVRMQPKLLPSLGISSVVYLEVDRVGSDTNDWHRDPEFLTDPIRVQLSTGTRGVESEWDHPAHVEADNRHHKPKTEGARASQYVIDTKRPEQVHPLNNAKLSGPHAYEFNWNKLPGLADMLSVYIEGLYDGFPAGIPDMADTVHLAEYVFGALSWQDMYSSDNEATRFLAQNYGQDSLSYANEVRNGEMVGSFMEAPHSLPLNFRDMRLSGLSYRQVRTDILDDNLRVFEKTHEWLSHITPETEADQRLVDDARRVTVFSLWTNGILHGA